MPTQRFFNLKEEKRRAIVRAAVHEFSRVPYSVASINQIIKEADISREVFTRILRIRTIFCNIWSADFGKSAGSGSTPSWS